MNRSNSSPAQTRQWRLWGYVSRIFLIGSLFVILGLNLSLAQVAPPTLTAPDNGPNIPKTSVKQVVDTEIQEIADLEMGWNLISLQVLPNDPSPSAVLAGLTQFGSQVDLNSAVDSLWCYDAQLERWLTWSPGGELNNIPGAGIQDMKIYQGYWLKLKFAGLKLHVEGSLPENGAVTLYPGWNLIGLDGGSNQDNFLADIESVFGDNVDLVEPSNSRIASVYQLSGDLSNNLVWDAFNDRPIGDSTAGLPPGNEPGTPNQDTLQSFIRGNGYWVFVTDGPSIVLQPRLRTILPADSDIQPTGNFPGAEDRDIDSDGVQDSSTWTSPDPETDDVQQSLFYPEEAGRREIILRNPGDGILSWRVEVDPGSANWLSVSPTEGKLIRGTAQVAVTVTRGALAGPSELNGNLTIRSTGGSRTIPVRALVPDIQGDYTGRARMTRVDGKEMQLPSLDFQITLDRAGDGTIRGIVNSEDSLSIPMDVPMAGDNYRSNSSDFTITGGYFMPGSGRENFDINDFNPLPGDLRREIRLNGLRTSENILSGKVQDTLHGILDQPVIVEGDFVLERTSLEPMGRQGSTVDWDPVGGTFGTETKRFPVTIPTRTLVEDVRVSLDLTHPRTSDIEIWLEGPTPAKGGAPIRVQLFNGAPGVDLETVFPDETFPSSGANALDAFDGIIGQGEWFLEITDHVDGPGGSQRLLSFQLEVLGPTVYSVQGVVQDDQGFPVDGAVVSLTGGVLLPYTETGPDGVFFFDSLTPNLYRATASKFGYESFNGEGQSAFYLDDVVAGLTLRIKRRMPLEPQLLFHPKEAVGPADLHLTYVTGSGTPPTTFSFQILRRDLQTGDPIGGIQTMQSPSPDATFASLLPGAYDIAVFTESTPPISFSQGVVIKPTAALESPSGAPPFRMAGSFGVGGGVVPGVYTPTNANASFPQVSNVVLNENMVDATTFDNDRLPGDGTFPVDSNSTDPLVQVDTDTRLVGAIPPTHLSVQGVGRISYSLFQGERGGDLVFDTCSEEEGQTWKCYRMVTSLGATISGYSTSSDLSLVGGGRPFPSDWTPEGGTP
ncbi:MAG: carboxypeptidase regulatory-like domain-containing protein [Candidatus Omnitrophica bacterium]|nr:carboxypeptidase regulatory-like domain-containing protein [Candidatus Omnitrophota bacterium]